MRKLPVRPAAVDALFLAGLLLFISSVSLHAASDHSAGKTRTYYVAADEVQWDYAPSGRDEAMGMPFDAIAKGFTESGPHQIGRVNKKAIYREYTDATFTTLKPRPPRGRSTSASSVPILRAEVGDTIKVVFKNNATHPYGMHPHGVLYEKDSEGADYNDGTSGADKEDGCVAPAPRTPTPGSVPERAGPGPERSQLRLLALPLALRRTARRRLRPLRHASSSPAAAWRSPMAAPKTSTTNSSPCSSPSMKTKAGTSTTTSVSTPPTPKA